MSTIYTLVNNLSVVTIENGELISYKVDHTEYMHQKGSKGWRNTDIEMFPVIGPTSKDDYRVQTPKGVAILDQHGLLRELEYSLIYSSDNCVKYQKKYTKNTLLKNNKFPEKSPKKEVFWPFDFTFEKEFILVNNKLTINFTLISEKGMPFMLGYHPAFLLSNTGKETIFSDSKKIGLKEVYNAGHNAYPFLKTDTLTLENINKSDIKITTKGFNNFMLWTQVDNMLCIEPISQYTSYVTEIFSEKNMRSSSGKEVFSMEIKVVDFD
ncbi:aldose 1-epimerase [Polaribacter tangerinus]|uniref:aldose 1-epimerase n=1 Tax=Polaribacter tangerinus TaxID=1920034 RepID=UPI000B4AB64D|nr:aldose 1-epimerase [Polaribacter tangerinus]